MLVVHVSRPSGGQMREQEQADGESAITLLRERLEAKGVSVQTLLMFSDDIARAILNTAVEREVTLICLGLTGKNVFAQTAGGECAGGVDQEHAGFRCCCSRRSIRGRFKSKDEGGRMKDAMLSD